MKEKKYKGVRSRNRDRNGNKVLKYYASISTNALKWYGRHRNTEREAAIDYDIKLIELGKNPVNILKPKL